MITAVQTPEIVGKELDIEIGSPVFALFLSDLNQKIQQTLFELHEGNFESGELSVRLSIDLEDAVFSYTARDRNGQPRLEGQRYKKPVITHKIAATLKKTAKAEGVFDDERELQLVDSKFKAVQIEKPQISIFDEEELT